MTKNSKLTVYIGGGCLTHGEQYMRQQEKEQVQALGFSTHAPQDDKEINDKTAQTVESNNNLAERIFDKDTKAMINADILIFEVSNNNVGTTAEIGQWAMIHRLAKEGIGGEEIKKLAQKPIFFHSTDVRDTDIPESGHRRSHSYNQYLLGSCYECNPKGVQKWEDILTQLHIIKSLYDAGLLIEFGNVSVKKDNISIKQDGNSCWNKGDKGATGVKGTDCGHPLNELPFKWTAKDTKPYVSMLSPWVEQFCDNVGIGHTFFTSNKYGDLFINGKKAVIKSKDDLND